MERARFLAPAARRAIPSSKPFLRTPMDHPCHKCGHSIEDGKAFCAQCGAPQIRVAVAEPSALSAAANVPASDRPIFSLDPPEVAGPLNLSALSAGIVWPRALRVCAVA